MKRIYALLVLSLVPSTYAQVLANKTSHTNFIFNGPSTTRVELKPDGTFDHPYNVSIRIIAFSQTRLVLECVARNSVWAQQGDNAYMTDGQPWREVYAVKDGKITFVKAIDPKITAAVSIPELIEWPKEDDK